MAVDRTRAACRATGRQLLAEPGGTGRHAGVPGLLHREFPRAGAEWTDPVSAGAS